MKNKTNLFVAAIVLMTSCSVTQNDSAGEAEVIAAEKVEGSDRSVRSDTTEGVVVGDIELIAIDRVDGVAGASLKTVTPQNGEALEPGSVSVTYGVRNFELGTQTTLRTDYELAESEQGQHIHAILNNEPYMAHYAPAFTEDLTEGQYLLLSFLSRSYHLSLKQKEAAELIQFTVGNPDQEPYDLNEPFLFYSRPKGTYDRSESTDILLDFYLVNCDLSETGYKVEAKIAGFDFTLNSWQPYVIRGLDKGLHTIRLELVDANGNTVDSPFNPVTRNFELK